MFLQNQEETYIHKSGTLFFLAFDTLMNGDLILTLHFVDEAFRKTPEVEHHHMKRIKRLFTWFLDTSSTEYGITFQ